MRPDVILLAVLILLANAPLLWGGFCDELAFLPGRVVAGEWWRVLTYPLVHVSPYHFLLDAGAFLLLYSGLGQPRMTRRLRLVAGAAAGSLLATLAAGPAVSARGLCGLSGVAHGLMAVWALELVREAGAQEVGLRAAGVLAFALVVGKSVLEAASGHVLFEGLHFGAVGIPSAVCHAGGILGALAVTRLVSHPAQKVVGAHSAPASTLTTTFCTDEALLHVRHGM